jgi:Flp pilus assembly protein TadG
LRILDKSRLKENDGATTVEFGLITVLLVIVLLSVVEMGRMVLVYTTMANSARAGARYAIVHGGDRTGSGATGPSGPGCTTGCAQINTVVNAFAQGGLLNTANLTTTVGYPDGTNTVGSRVTVTVSYTYDPMIRYFSTILNKPLGSTSQGVITF